jgi:geranylgeranyl pyrophosphate synthase
MTVDPFDQPPPDQATVQRMQDEQDLQYDQMKAGEQQEQGHSQEYLSLLHSVLGEDEVERRKAQAKEHALWDRKMGVLSGDCYACDAEASMHPIGPNGWEMCLVCSYSQDPAVVDDRQMNEDLKRISEKD